jgi:phosphatidylglycerophosphatase A
VIIRPNLAFLLAHPAHFIALGFGAGLAPVAPGTAGTLLAFPLFMLVSPVLQPEWKLLALIVALFLLGIWACARTGAALGIPDHGAMVWDEVVAFMLILVFTPAGLGWQSFAFVVFRLFDVLKPSPIREVDRRWKGGFGVMFDDLVAAAYSLIVIAIAKRLAG